MRQMRVNMSKARSKYIDSYLVGEGNKSKR
jgi:hypothetical protein